MGCCGHDFISEEKINDAIRLNTKEFQNKNPQTEQHYEEFRDRTHKNNLRHGVCRNLIKENDCILCPLHPARHGKDLRENHCDTSYLCKTAKQFAKWDEHTQRAFIYFIESKQLNNIQYSLAMDKHTLLKEFQQLQ